MHLVLILIISPKLFVTEADSTNAVHIDLLKISIQNVYQNSNDDPITEIYYSTVSSKLEKPLGVRVLYEWIRSINNFLVIFKVISTSPKSKNTMFLTDTVYTDLHDFAENFVQAELIKIKKNKTRMHE